MKRRFEIHWTGRDSHGNIITTGWTTYTPTDEKPMEKELERIQTELIHEKGTYLHMTWTITEPNY